LIYSRKIPPEEDGKKHNLWLKYVRWKQKYKEIFPKRLKGIEFMKGKYKFKINTKKMELIEWKEKWKNAKRRWTTKIDIFEDLEVEDLLAYLIINDNPKGRKNEDEFNWQQFCALTNKKTILQFIDNS
jgi:hypothetical protein